MKILNVSHKHCTDGFISSYIIRSFLGRSDEIDYLMLEYTDNFQTMLDSANADSMDLIIITDMSFKPKYTSYVNRLMSAGVGVVIIDHHDTAAWLVDVESWVDSENIGKVDVRYDEHLSGAILTFNFLMENTYGYWGMDWMAKDTGKALVDEKAWKIRGLESEARLARCARLASDYDLFTKKYVCSDYLNDFTQHHLKINDGDLGGVFEIFDMNLPDVSGDPTEDYTTWPMLVEGKTCYDVRMALVKSVYSVPDRVIDARSLFGPELLPETDNYDVYIFNANYPFVSAGSHLHKDNCLMVLSWQTVPNGSIKFSIRADKDKEHPLNKIALHFGGGGHKSACGFTIDVNSDLPSHKHVVDVVMGKDIS